MKKLILLFVTNFSIAQVSLVKEINPFSAQTGRIVILENHAYFGSYALGSGGLLKGGLFKTDGTLSGTVRITDPNLDIFVKEPTSSGTFVGWSGSNLGGTGERPWVYNGVTASVVGNNSFVQTLHAYNNQILFAGHTFDEGFELWKINTAGESEMVKNLPGVGPNNTITPSMFVNHSDGFAYFLGWADNAPCALWKTNGTTAGTTKVKDVPYMNKLYSAGANLYLFGPNSGSYTGNYKLWVSDGTTAGTVVVKDFNPAGYPVHSDAYTFDNRLFFSLDDGINGKELWFSDGTTAGTQMVADINPGAAPSNATALGHVGGALYVAANNGSIGPALYKIGSNPLVIVNGIPHYSFTLVKDINTVSDATSYFNTGIAFQNKFYFPAGDGGTNTELWRTDGTLAGTEKLGTTVAPKGFCVLNNILLFGSYNETSWNFDLYKYQDPSFVPCQNTVSYQGIATDVLYEANNSIVSIHTVPALPNFTIYKAKAITLNPGFRTESGAKFTTISAGCQ